MTIFQKLSIFSRGNGLFHMKVTVSVTKRLLQDCDLCYLHLPNFFLHIHSPLVLENSFQYD